MLQKIFLSLFIFSLNWLNLFALEISIQVAKENYESYSTLHIKDDNKFLCKEIKNDFDETVKIVCAFSKSPSKKLHKIQNNFFNLDSQVKNKTFFIIITTNKKMKLFPMIFNLSKEDTVFKSDVKMSSHWMILGYKEKIPLIKINKYSDISINFPFTHLANKLPYVGGIDIYGKPVHIKTVEDVTSYIKIKKLFDKKQYELCLNLIEEVLQAYPYTLFLAELSYYKIKVYNQLKDFDNIIDTSKIYLKEYSSDENVAEVLALVSNAYSKIGLNVDAEYFFDRLFSEHKPSVFAKWGYIYKGEMLENSGGVSKAIIMYEKALNLTKNINVAATAAYRLANLYLANSNSKKSVIYIDKIAKAKPNFFAENFEKSIEMMYDYIEIEDYKSGATVAKCLLDNIKDTHDDHEYLTKSIGIWLSKTENKEGALKALNLYLKNYSEGIYEHEVQIAKDSLFFDTQDENLTTKLDNYTELINVYAGDSIGNRAIYEKAKLLLINKMYTKMLELERDLLVLDNLVYKDVNEMISDAAIGAMELALKNKQCESVLKISSKYKIKLSNDWDDGIYECSMKGGDYSLAKLISDKNLKSKKMALRKKWLYRYIKVDFETGNYTNIVSASKELISMIKEDKDSKYKQVYRILFDTYHRLENTQGMLNSITDIKSVYGKNYKDIDRYVEMVTLGDKLKDDNLIIKYAKEVVDIQNTSKSYAQSPFIEFALYQAYINKENNNDALEIIESLNDKKLNKSDRSRQKYLLGSIYSKLWRNDDAKEAYQEAIDAEASSAWADLAKGAKGI
ncbi:MAG: flagellar protein [Sulfurimonas sp.]|nr:MAG: flagellar protein [Sulfurimonas sp.]